MNRVSTILVSGFLAASAAACGGSSDGTSSAAGTPSAAATTTASTPPAATPAATSGPAASQAAAPAVVTIKDFAFTAPVSVAAGATVQVNNGDGEAHTVTADSGGAFDAKVDGSGTASFTAPTKPGRYPFHCTYHSTMHGVLVVT